MSAAFEIASVGLSVQQRALDVTANNIANINTPAFRRSELRFSEIVAATGAVASANLSPQPMSAGLSASAVVDWEAQGPIEQSGKPLDLAINGRGFVELVGPDGDVLLWRGGALQVGEDGLLAAPNGAPLKAGITVPGDAQSIEIAPDGQVLARFGGRRGLETLGRIEIVLPSSYADLEPIDGGYARLSAGAPVVSATAGEDGAGVFVQGALERSSVDLNVEMVRLLIVQRAYAANAQVVQAADQLTALANNLRK